MYRSIPDTSVRVDRWCRYSGAVFWWMMARRCGGTSRWESKVFTRVPRTPPHHALRRPTTVICFFVQKNHRALCVNVLGVTGLFQLLDSPM